MTGILERAFRRIRGQREKQAGPPPDGHSLRELENREFLRLAETRRVSRRFQYQTLAWTAFLLGVLGLLSAKLYSDAKEDIEEQFNRQQLVLAQQAGENIASFLADLTATLRYSASFLRTTAPDHPGRMSAIAGLYERLGGRFRVSEVGYIHEKSPIGADFPERYLKELPRCAAQDGSCLLFIRGTKGSPAYLFSAAPVDEGDWIYAKVSMDDLERSFVRTVKSGRKGKAWILDQEGRILIVPGLSKLEGMRLSDLAKSLGAPRLLAIAEQMKEGRSGFDWHSDLRSGRYKRKNRYLTAFSTFQVGRERWTFAVTARSSEFVGLIRRSFRKGFLLTGFGIIVVISAALLILDRERRRIRAEDQLHWSGQVLESKERLQALFDGITDSICILDRAFRIQMLNRAMARLFGCEIADLLGQPWEPGAETRVPETFAEQDLVRQTFETGRHGFAEKSVLIADGKRMDVEFYSYPILDAAGGAVQVILYLKDVTERRSLQREIQQKDRLTIVGKMSAQVAHEIRNPLSAINLNAELLEDELLRFKESDTSEAWALLRSVKTEVDVLRQVTDDYLKFVRMPRSGHGPSDLNGMIDDLLIFHAEEAASRNIRIERELASDLPEVTMDETQMRVALQNLLLNGFDAMPEGGKLVIRTRRLKERVSIDIADTGVGIRSEDQASVFTPFFTTKANGTGLGLVLAQQIITEHKGTIRFASQEGSGTTFHIDLPAVVQQGAKV